MAWRPATPAPSTSDLSGRHRAGGGHAEREELPQPAGGDDRAPVARTSACELSASIDCAREIRGTYSMREGGDPGGLSGRDVVGPLPGEQEGHGGRAGRAEAQGLEADRLHAEHQAGAVQRVLADRGPRRGVRLVVDQRPATGTRLDRHLVARAGQPADQLRDQRDPGLTRLGLPSDRNPHATNLVHGAYRSPVVDTRPGGFRVGRSRTSRSSARSVDNPDRRVCRWTQPLSRSPVWTFVRGS